jgi:hypothetical protein
MKSMALGLVVFILAGSTHAEVANLTVEAAQPVHPVSPLLWGIFFEDINHSADGGIYPEMVRNRSFEDSDKPENWIVNSSTYQFHALQRTTKPNSNYDALGVSPGL